MMRNELGQYLAETLDLYLGEDDVRSRPWFRQTVGDLLTHVDAYVQADRERIAQAIETIPVEYKHGNDRYPGYVRTEAARIARADS